MSIDTSLPPSREQQVDGNSDWLKVHGVDIPQNTFPINKDACTSLTVNLEADFLSKKYSEILLSLFHKKIINFIQR